MRTLANFVGPRQFAERLRRLQPMIWKGRLVLIIRTTREFTRMRHATVVQQVRDLVEQNFRSLGISVDSGIEETILVRNGFYCGRRFAADSAHAIWFCEEDQVKFYGSNGAVLRVLQKIGRQLALETSSLETCALDTHALDSQALSDAA